MTRIYEPNDNEKRWWLHDQCDRANEEVPSSRWTPSCTFTQFRQKTCVSSPVDLPSSSAHRHRHCCYRRSCLATTTATKWWMVSIFLTLRQGNLHSSHSRPLQHASRPVNGRCGHCNRWPSWHRASRSCRPLHRPLQLFKLHLEFSAVHHNPSHCCCRVSR